MERRYPPALAIKCDLAANDKGRATDFHVGQSRLATTNRFLSYSSYRDTPILIPPQFYEATGTVIPGEIDMGKYFVAWLLGVPAVVLVIVYVFFH